MINPYEINICPICRNKLRTVDFGNGIEYICRKSKMIDGELYYDDHYVVIITETFCEQDLELDNYVIYNAAKSDYSEIYSNIPHRFLFNLPKLDINLDTDFLKLKQSLDKFALFS